MARQETLFTSTTIIMPGLRSGYSEDGFRLREVTINQFDQTPSSSVSSQSTTEVIKPVISGNVPYKPSPGK